MKNTENTVLDLSGKTRELIDSITDKDFIAAKNTFDSIIAQKSISAIESEKENIASEMFPSER